MNDIRSSASASETATGEDTAAFTPTSASGQAGTVAQPGHPALRRALDHAPDRNEEPSEELRQAIRAFAHESAAPSLPQRRAGLLRRLSGGEATGLEARANARRSRLLRNLIVAVILIGIVATVTLHREPAPGSRRPGATAPDAAGTPAAPPQSVASQAAPVTSAPASAAVPVASAPVLSEAEKILFAPRIPLPLPPEAPAPTSPPVALAPVPAPAALTKSASAVPTTPAMPATPFPAPASGMPSEGAGGRMAAATTPGGRATASFGVPGGVAGTSIPAAKTAAEAPPPAPPSFAALSQWTQLTLTRADGTTRRRSKADVRELGALLGSAALAGAGAEPVAGSVDWRIALERNGQTLARMELAGNQVRWIETGAAPGTGSPPAGSLASVREMLEKEFDSPSTASSAAPAPLVPLVPTPVPAPAAVAVPATESTDAGPGR